MILLTKLFLAHIIGDFILQPKRWVIQKESKKAASAFLYLHILIHFLLVIVILWDINYWQIALIIASSHYVIDLLKIYLTPAFKNKAVPFFLDQFLHIVVLYICVYYGNLIEHTNSLIEQIDWRLLTVMVFVTYPAAILMRILLEGMSNQINLDHKSLPNAGKYIGIIERLFVLVFIIMDRWEAIGLLITAKSVFRFNDLKESNSRKLTEYILIGTLLSFGIAIIAGIIYNYI
ncbi:DUF3307 domain-containing protein [uncultured Eudoraea sp.]|uniref:DUF3307 domain-containing protein n=1 Tax=uncultured Eudoraea sp. TaxID=1035614 RepID=UPI002605F88B|nr:DUF3307 domain-containing protein [uncultured Eudoraea sp.]